MNNEHKIKTLVSVANRFDIDVSDCQSTRSLLKRIAEYKLPIIEITESEIDEIGSLSRQYNVDIEYDENRNRMGD